MEEVPKISSNKMSHKGFLGAFQMSMLFMKFCIDGTPQRFWQPTKDDNMPCERMTQVCHKKGRQSVAAPLASDFCKSDHLQLSSIYFTFLAF